MFYHSSLIAKELQIGHIAEGSLFKLYHKEYFYFFETIAAVFTLLLSFWKLKFLFLSSGF